MPSPTIRCEFCQEDNTMRRDVYAVHCKSKHTKEIATMLLDEMKEMTFSTLQAYASTLATTSLTIESRIYPGAEYWMGVKPLFYQRESPEMMDKPGVPLSKQKGYDEDVKKTNYLKSAENQAAHRAFVEEVIGSISLLDYLKAQKELRVRSPEVTAMSRELTSLKAEHEALAESSKREIERLRAESAGWRESMEEQEFIPEMKRELTNTRSYLATKEREIRTLKQRLENVEKEFNDRWEELIESRRSADRVNQDQILQLTDKTKKLQEENESLKVNVKREAAKLVEKAEQKDEKEAEKKAKEAKKAKAKLKMAKLLAKLQAADSSDSDSD